MILVMFNQLIQRATYARKIPYWGETRIRGICNLTRERGMKVGNVGLNYGRIKNGEKRIGGNHDWSY